MRVVFVAVAVEIKGVTYDVGRPTVDGGYTRPVLSDGVAARELAVIAKDLHCNAVRITGDNLSRIATAAELAAGLRMAAWLSPSLDDATPEQHLGQLEQTASVAGELQAAGADVVVVVGCELSVFMEGFIPGASASERLAILADPNYWMAEGAAEAGAEMMRRFDTHLANAAKTVRSTFRGPITYAAGLWEQVDWHAFDYVGLDAYRDAGNRTNFADVLRAQASTHGPLVVTEFGCCTYRGAADRGAMGWAAVDRSASPPRLREGIIRDEKAQADELVALLEIFEAIRASGAFVFTFVAPNYPSNIDPGYDLDTASFSLVRTWPDGISRAPFDLPLEPKESFAAVADLYGRGAKL